MINNIKLTTKIILQATNEQLPPNANIVGEDPLPWKRVIISKHAAERFKERLHIEPNNRDLGIYISKKLKEGYYIQSKKMNTTFILRIKIGEVPMIVVCALNDDVYIVKTVYYDFNHEFSKALVKEYQKEKDDVEFDSLIKARFFKSASEEFFFNELEFNKQAFLVASSYKKRHDIKNSTIALQELLDEYEKQKMLSESGEISFEDYPHVREYQARKAQMKNNKQKSHPYGFTLTADDFEDFDD